MLILSERKCPIIFLAGMGILVVCQAQAMPTHAMGNGGTWCPHDGLRTMRIWWTWAGLGLANPVGGPVWVSMSFNDNCLGDMGFTTW